MLPVEFNTLSKIRINSPYVLGTVQKGQRKLVSIVYNILNTKKTDCFMSMLL